MQRGVRYLGERTSDKPTASIVGLTSRWQLTKRTLRPADCWRNVHRIGRLAPRGGCPRRSRSTALLRELLPSAGCSSGILPRPAAYLASRIGEGCAHDTLLSSGICFMSILFILEQTTLATSRSLRPHSSVFVARNIQDAATSCYKVSCSPCTCSISAYLSVIILHGVSHVKSMEPCSSGVHSR